MQYIKVKLPKCTVFITPEEINKLLEKDPALYGDILKRSKAFIRATKVREVKLPHRYRN